MNPLAWLGRQLDAGWFGRALVLVQVAFAWNLLTWSEAFASTALATKADLVGTAGVIAATAAAPLGLITLAINKYLEMRANQPVVMKDRRREHDAS